MTEPKKESPVRNKDFEKEKIELIKLRIKNKFYERSDVLENVAASILKKEIPHPGSAS